MIATHHPSHCSAYRCLVIAVQALEVFVAAMHVSSIGSVLQRNYYSEFSLSHSFEIINLNLNLIIKINLNVPESYHDLYWNIALISDYQLKEI